MKKFISKCIIFIIFTFILAFIWESIIRQVPNTYRYKYDWMQKNAENVDIIILGSSHTFYGIRPSILSKRAFSLANVSQDIKHDKYLLEYWANRYHQLRAVIFPISFSTWFGKGLEYGQESWRCKFYRIYMDCDLHSACSMSNFELSDMTSAKAKTIRFAKSIFIKDIDYGCDSLGWGNTYLISNKNPEQWNDGTEACAAVKRHTASNWDNINMNYSILGEIAIFCRKRNIQLILITTPCWSSYYENLNKAQLLKMNELTEVFCKTYNIPYFNYLQDKRFIAEDFYDSNHLSDIGSSKFSKILKEDICNLVNQSTTHTTYQ